MLTLNIANELLNQALEIASEEGFSIAIALVDDHGELITYGRMDNASPHAGLLAKNKAYTASRDRQSTKELAAWAQETGKDMAYWSDPRFTGIAGGLPIISEGKVIGGIGISGLSEQEDHQLAERTLKRLDK